MTYSSQIQTSFSGPSSTSTYPPHNGLAVGPNNIVMVEGTQIEWTNLTGGSPTLQSVYSFFSPLSPTGGLYDQRCVYDSVNQRYVVIMEYLASGGAVSDIDVAVSKDSNPSDGWYFSSLNTSLTINGQLTASDRPMLSTDGTNIYITAPQYNVNVSGYAGTECWVIGDTAGAGGGIYKGGTMTVTAKQLTPSTQGISASVAGSNGKTYYASDFSSGGQIMLALQTYDATTNTFGTTSKISLGNIDQGGAYTVQQKGTSLLLDAVDNRIASMVYANGFLYGVAEMKPTGSSVPLVHWFKIDVSNPNAPTLAAQGDISGTSIGSNVATFNPSIAVDASGDVIINFTASGPNTYPQDYYVFHGGSDPSGSFSAPVLYQASTGFFNSGNGSSVQRWGLNSSATVDPNNPNSFWISNEYVANGWWRTSVARVAIQNSTGTAPTVSSIAASGTGITGGAGDLNAGKMITLTVNFSAAVTVNTTGGTPTLTFNDGATASFIGGSGSAALTFSYTVAAGQNTPDLAVASLNLNGATIKDGAGNVADLTGATNYNPAGTLQIDTTAPVPVFVQEPPSTTASSTAAFTFGTSNSETNGVSYAYRLDGATTFTPVSGSTLSLSGLANGTHAIQLQATDGAGNPSVSPASYNWTITPAAPASAQIETVFSGPSTTSTYPPHNGLAVGPNNIVMIDGSRIEWTNLTGGSPTQQSVYSFFSPLSPTGGLYDQRIAYDSVNQRYVVIMQYLASGATVSDIDIAVSKDSNPNDGWFFSSLNTSLTINGQLTASDRPTLSTDGTNIYITAPQLYVTSGYAGTEEWVIGDTAGAGGGIYGGGTLTVTANQLTSPNQGMFAVAAGNNGTSYYASSYSTGNQIVVSLQTYSAATNTFGPTGTVTLGNIDQGGSYTAQQLGTTLLLDANDKRVASMVYANGFLYGVAEMKPTGSSVPLVHWFKIDVSNPSAPTLAAQGDISGAAIGSNVATFNPSIAVDASGDVIINFTASGPNMYPGDYYVVQKGSDPAGSFSAPVSYQASTGFFNSGNGASVQPWGIYSTATVDPNNPNSFWLSNEYVAGGWWQTSVAQVAIEGGEAPTLAVGNQALTVAAGGSIPLGITATPVDPDDAISLTISGVPTYETITAPGGNTVTSSLQADGTNSWTITEGASATGTPLSGLALTSHYTGTGHPVATFTVTASNTTSGETAASASQTIAVTDPPAIALAGATGASPHAPAVSSANPAHMDRLVALMDQFAAAGFHGDHAGAGAIALSAGANPGREDALSLLAAAHTHPAWAHS